MKRKLLLFAAVLIVMLVVKYAFGQGSPEVSSTGLSWNSSDPTRDVISLMFAAPLAGLGIAALRILWWPYARPVLQPLRLK